MFCCCAILRRRRGSPGAFGGQAALRPTRAVYSPVAHQRRETLHWRAAGGIQGRAHRHTGIHRRATAAVMITPRFLVAAPLGRDGELICSLLKSSGYAAEAVTTIR